MINGFTRLLNRIKIPDWIPLIGGKGINIPSIPHLARGTDYFGGGLAVVGERGRELVNLPKGSQVVSNDELSGLLRGAGNVTVNIYSPKALSPAEIAREFKKTQQELALGF